MKSLSVGELLKIQIPVVPYALITTKGTEFKICLILCPNGTVCVHTSVDAKVVVSKRQHMQGIISGKLFQSGREMRTGNALPHEAMGRLEYRSFHLRIPGTSPESESG